MAGNFPSLTWRPAALQMPMVQGSQTLSPPNSPRGPIALTAGYDGRSRGSVVVGPQTHRLPASDMWRITLLVSVGMAVINFASILVIEQLVHFKFLTMELAINHSGVGFAICILSAVSMLYAFAGACLVIFLAPGCGGSGLPENKCYLNGSPMPGLFTKTTLGVRIATTILSNAAGFPVGREGPTVTIGSNYAYLLSMRLTARHFKEWVEISEARACTEMVDDQRLAHATRVACSVGGACAMAVIFNAPFGGLLYMFEEITSVSWPLELTFRVFVGTMLCSLLSYALCFLVNSDIEEFVIYAAKPMDKEWDTVDLPIFVVISACLGMMTSLHTRAMLGVAAWRSRVQRRLGTWSPYERVLETVFYAALCASLSALVALLDNCTTKGKSNLQYVEFNCPEGEYNPVASLLVTTSHSAVKTLFSGNNAGEIGAASSLLAFFTYLTLQLGLSGLPVPGGAFTATMLLGGLFGRFAGELCRDLKIVSTASGVYSVVGAAAMLCGFKQMTLASVLIVVECINDLRLAPVVMLGVAVSMAVNWRMNERGHDEEQIIRKNLPFLEGEAPYELDCVAALDLCERFSEEAVLTPVASVPQAKAALAASEATYFPIRDGVENPCIGVITRQKLQAAIKAALENRGTQRDTLQASVGSPSYEGYIDASGEELVWEARTGTSSTAASGASGDMLPLHSMMDPNPFTIVEDMPAPRLYALFAKVGEHCVVVTSIRGEFRGLISRTALIAAARQRPFVGVGAV